MSYFESIPSHDFPKVFGNSILRSGLLDRIENTHTGSVLVCSMAGYGKSTLLSQLTTRAQCAAVCILGDADNTLPSFLSHLSAAVRQSVPSFEADDAESAYVRLSRICRAAVGEGMTLIFDNCQAVKDEAVCGALQSIMSAAESGFKVVIGSREIPDFAIRFILEERCKLFGRDDLSLSESEVAEVVKMRLKEENPQLARDLHALTEGWAAGVMFCLRGSGAYFAKEAPAWESKTDSRFIKQYIAYEILAGLPKNVVEFSKRASLFDYLSVDFCDIVLDTNNSRECLNYLRENDIFLRERFGEPESFAWIDIFQKTMFLLLTTKEKMLIVERAAEYYFRRKMHFEAIRIALKFGQSALICRALSLCGTSLLEEEQFDLLGSCARALEKSVEDLDTPIYGVLAQYYYVIGDYAKMEYNFNMADSMFGKENNYSVQRSLYRGLLKFESDPKNYRKLVNNALFYLVEYNIKLPLLLPREQKVLEEIKRLNAADEETHDKKPLKVTQFGFFKVIVAEDGRELLWRTKKGCELFAYLISIEGNAVERNRLFDIIWKEELPNNPVAMLHNMIYNIRKELSAYKLENLVQYKNKRYSIDMSLIDCDMDTVSRVCSAIFRKDMDVLLENESVISDYWGVYLENIDNVWVTEHKDYYDKMFINGSLLLADSYYDNRIYEKALVYLQNALKVDTFSERIMEKILNCYAKIGKFDKLRAKYEEFCEMLVRELGIQPSDDLKSAYQRSIQRKI
jgi:two-component SAPR family response regulator